jgi:DNA-binding protein YbaB
VSSLDREPLLTALGELQQEAAVLGAVLGAALESEAVYHGADDSDVVRATMNGAGRVVDIEVAASWQRTVGVPGLHHTVLAAVADAARRRMQAWASAVEDRSGQQSRDDPPQPYGPQPQAGLGADAQGDPSLQAQVTDGSALAFTGELLALIRQVDGELDQFTSTLAEQAGRDITGHGPERMAVVTVRGGEVVGVNLDERWLGRSGPRSIAAELTAAFDAAQSAADRDRAAALTSAGPINRLREVTTDFGSVLARLGLGRT